MVSGGGMADLSLKLTVDDNSIESVNRTRCCGLGSGRVYLCSVQRQATILVRHHYVEDTCQFEQH